MCNQTFQGPAYMVDGSRRRRRRWTRVTLLICPACYSKPPVERSLPSLQWLLLRSELGGEMPPTPCVHCGRVIIRGANVRLKRVTCSKMCSTALTRVSAGNAGSGQPCADCGAAITTGRSDSKFCSASCRQRAYRRRQARDRHV